MGSVLSYFQIPNYSTHFNNNLYLNSSFNDYKYLDNKLKYYDLIYNKIQNNNKMSEDINSDDISSIDNKSLDNVNSFMECIKSYNLYIYVSPELPNDIKEKYIENSIKHNLAIDSYFDSLNSSEIDSSCFDSGFDLICPTDIISYGTQSLILDHKVKCCMKCDKRYVGYYLYSRSSTASKTPLRLANSVGVIDSGYRGNIIAMFDNVKDYDFMEYDVTCGHRYVQICPPNLEYPMRVYIVDNEFDLGKETVRGNGGFGSQVIKLFEYINHYFFNNNQV